MEFAYLCRLRRGEVIGPDIRDVSEENPLKYEGLQRKHIVDEGLHVFRGKGSKEQIIGWTPRLRKAVRNALVMPSIVGSVYLLHDNKGQKIRKKVFERAFRLAMKQAVKEEGIEPFHYHDLKAKGVSDFDGDKMKASGHKSLKMVAVYDRKLEIVDSTK